MVFYHEPPIEGRRMCLANIGGVSSREEAEAVARERWPGIVRFKWVRVQVKIRKGKRGRGPQALPVELPSDLTDRIRQAAAKAGAAGAETLAQRASKPK
jgi:hypothetical protein